MDHLYDKEITMVNRGTKKKGGKKKGGKKKGGKKK